jgi:hypothetical protein
VDVNCTHHSPVKTSFFIRPLTQSCVYQGFWTTAF